jgi:hypothetical protein
MVTEIFSWIQIATCVVAFLTILGLSGWVARNPRKWGITIIPFGWLVHLVVYYLWVFFINDPVIDPNSATVWSAYLRLNGVFVGLLMVYYHLLVGKKVDEINGRK